MKKTKNNKKIIISLVTVFLFLGGTVYGSMRYVQQQRASVSIPEDAKEYASEEDLIKAVCYEAKWKGGEGVARIEALEHVLLPGLEGLKDLDISFENSVDLKEKSEEMRSQLESICNASTINEASERVNNYINYAQETKRLFEGDFSADLRGMESQLREKGKKLKEKIESELKKEGEEMAEKIESELREEAEREARELENQLRQLGSEFESFMAQGEIGPGQARAKAKELSGRISADAKTTGFLSNKFEEILRKAEAVIPKAMSGEMSPGQIQNMVRSEVPGVVAEIKEFMEEKYRERGKQKEAEVREMLEEKAKEIGGEDKKALESVRDSFENAEERIDDEYEKRKGEWSEYEEKAKEKKREIVSAAVNKHFDKAIELIRERREDIDMAFEIGVAEEYGIIPYDELIEMIEKDREEIINEFTKSDFDSQEIRETKRKFQEKWNNYQSKMEKIEVVGDGTLQSVLRKYWDDHRTDWSRVERGISIHIGNMGILERYLSRTQESYEACLQRGEELTPRKVQTKIDEENISVFSDEAKEIRALCRDCEVLEEIGDLGAIWLERVDLDEVREKEKAFRRDAEEFQRILSVYSRERNLPINEAPIPLTEFFEAKDRLIDLKNYFEEIETLSGEVVDIYRPKYREATTSCWNR